MSRCSKVWFDGEPGRVDALRRMVEAPLDGDRQVVSPRVVYAKPATAIEKARMGARRRLAARTAHMHLRSA